MRSIITAAALVACHIQLYAYSCMWLACAGGAAAFAPPPVRVQGGPALVLTARGPALTVARLNRAKKNLAGGGQDDGESPQVGPPRCGGCRHACLLCIVPPLTATAGAQSDKSQLSELWGSAHRKQRERQDGGNTGGSSADDFSGWLPSKLLPPDGPLAAAPAARLVSFLVAP